MAENTKAMDHVAEAVAEAMEAAAAGAAEAGKDAGKEVEEISLKFGKGIWEDRKSFVPNRELKNMVEAYKTKDREASDHESVIGKLDGMKQ